MQQVTNLPDILVLVGLAQGDFSINSHDGERKIVNEIERERGMGEKERKGERV